MKTEKQQLLEKRNLAIYREFERLTADGGSRTAATQLLMRKYQLFSATSVYKIRKQVESQLLNQAK